MTNPNDVHRARAEARFKQPDRAPSDPGKAAYDAEAAAREANTERLKRLRLAKEESEREAIAVNKAKRSLRAR